MTTTDPEVFDWQVECPEYATPEEKADTTALIYAAANRLAALAKETRP